MHAQYIMRSAIGSDLASCLALANCSSAFMSVQEPYIRVPFCAPAITDRLSPCVPALFNLINSWWANLSMESFLINPLAHGPGLTNHPSHLHHLSNESLMIKNMMPACKVDSYFPGQLGWPWGIPLVSPEQGQWNYVLCPM